MRILLAADGSPYTKKALGFLIANESLLAAPNELHVLHVQPPLPPHVKGAVGKKIVDDYYLEETEKVLAPIRKFLEHHPVKFHADSMVGSPAEEIIKAAQNEKAHLIVMGTHGHGVLGSILMGSVAQRVVAGSTVPVLLVK